MRRIVLDDAVIRRLNIVMESLVRGETIAVWGEHDTGGQNPDGSWITDVMDTGIRLAVVTKP